MKKIVLIILGLMILVGVYFGYGFYNRLFDKNVALKEDFVLYIPTDGTYQGVLDTLSKHMVLKDEESFEWVAERKKYPQKVRPGRYVIKDGMKNNELVNKLRSANQDALNFTLYDISGVYELAGKLGQKLEGDSIQFLDYLTNEQALKEYDLDINTITAYFLPNTYQFYWNSSPESVLKRMEKEFGKFWNDERLRKAKEMDLSPIEVVTLASIVERETIKKDEQARVAGLYYNRIKKGMKLQSDPTAVYGINLEFPKKRITRVYHKHLAYDSPYNTYLYSGLPPGPIKIPSLHAIDAVLDHEKHEYIFMVADPEKLGYHQFAETYRQHQANDRRYKRLR